MVRAARLLPPDQAQLVVFLADLRSLVAQARAHGKSYPATNPQSHYWFDVAVGYEDAAARLEAMLPADGE